MTVLNDNIRPVGVDRRNGRARPSTPPVNSIELHIANIDLRIPDHGIVGRQAHDARIDSQVAGAEPFT